MKEELFQNIIKLLKAGYEIHLTDNSIDVVEVYKSRSREKWHEIKVKSSFGSFGYWGDGAIQIISNNFKDYIEELLPTEKKI